jgi:four helix bundle protein
MPEEMVIFTRTYDFISWLLPLTEHFPRSQRFVVTRRLQDAALNFQELILEANAERGTPRVEKLKTADVELRKVRLYLRLGQKWEWIKEGQYRHASTLVAEIGKLLGGWKKAS